METSVDREVSYTQSNPLFGMSLSRSDLYGFQQDDLKRARPRRQWCFNVVVVYLILQAALNAFLLYKVFTLESSQSASPQSGPFTDKHTDGEDLQSLVQNTTKENQNLRGHLWDLQKQVKTVCSDQISRLQTEVISLNSSTQTLDSRIKTISLQPGPQGPPGGPGKPGESGPKGDRGDAGPIGSKGEPGQAGETGPAGPPGPEGPTGPTGPSGDQGPGAKGEKGDPGLQGPQGEKGDTGLAGTPGPAGEKGDRGDIGPPGLPGVAGTPGDHGIPGIPGQKGDKGNSALGETNVRLVPGPSRGRVEVRYNGVWGTVCDDNFDNVDGKVICKMLGYQTALTTFTAAPGTGRTWLDELRCSGTETDIFSCPHAGMGMHNCQHSEDAGIQCI